MFNLYCKSKVLISSTRDQSNLQFSWDYFKSNSNYLIRKPEQSFFSKKHVQDFIQRTLTDCTENSQNISIVTESKELIDEILKLEFYKKYFVLVTKYTPIWFNHIQDCSYFSNIESNFY